MLKSENRLLSNYEFKKTRRAGRSISGKYFHLYYLKPHNYNGPSRVGIVISTKFSKSAVKRNRLKRVFREVIRQNSDKIGTGHWITVYPKFTAGNKDYEEINSDFTETIQKVSFTG